MSLGHTPTHGGIQSPVPLHLRGQNAAWHVAGVCLVNETENHEKPSWERRSPRLKGWCWKLMTKNTPEVSRTDLMTDEMLESQISQESNSGAKKA